MKYISQYLILSLTMLFALLITVACSEEIGMPADGGRVSINMSRANAKATSGEYALVFWVGDKIENAWTSSLGAGSAEGQVDYYNFNKQNNYVVQKDGKDLYYDHGDIPINAFGYYPYSALESATNYSSFTLKDSNTPGLVDVCITDIEKGSYSKPFTAEQDNELQFKHTQVKLNFRVRQTEDVFGFISDVRIKIPGSAIANQWTRNGNVFEAGLQSGSQPGDLMFTAGAVNWIENPTDFTLLEYTKGEFDYSKAILIKDITDITDCYVLPNAGMFSMNQDGVQCITFEINAKIIKTSLEDGPPSRQMSGTVMLALTDDDGNAWTDPISAGNHFVIDIVFTQNQMMLFAEKVDWEQGGYIVVPLNPNSGSATNP